MKRTLTLAALLTSFGLNAQFTTPSAGTTYTNDNVGIGTSTPAQLLHIKGLNGIRLEGTGTGTDIIDMIPGLAVGFSRLDYRAANTNRGISVQFMPNGVATSSKFVLANQSDQNNFGSVFFLAEASGFAISPQNVNVAANPMTSLSIGGGTQGGTWSKVVLPGTVNFGIGTSTPADRFHLQGTTTGLKINPDLSGGSYIYSHNGTAFTPLVLQGSTLQFQTGSASAAQRMIIDANGYVGIGVANPEVALDVTPSIAVRGGSANIHFRDPAGSTQFQMGLATSAGGYCNTCQPGDFVISKVNNVGDLYLTNNISGAIHFKTGTSYATSNFVMSIVGSNVLIGKTSQSNTNYKLDVNGNIRANKIVVNTTGADFVFEPNYTLLPLQSVETFIKKYHHLPGIASAKEMQNKGLDVGIHQTALLQKTEELTLYIIEQNKTIEELKLYISIQKKQLIDQNNKLASQDSSLAKKDAEINELKQTLDSVLKRLEVLEQK